MHRITPDYTLYLVTDRGAARGSRSLEDVVREAIEGGVTMVQLREKNAATREFLELATALRAVTAGSGVCLSSSTTASTSPSRAGRTASTWARTT